MRKLQNNDVGLGVTSGVVDFLADLIPNVQTAISKTRPNWYRSLDRSRAYLPVRHILHDLLLPCQSRYVPAVSISVLLGKNQRYEMNSTPSRFPLEFSADRER